MNIKKFKEIIKNNILNTYNNFPELDLILINSFFWNSKEGKNIIFFAIKGVNEDGNKYIEDAIKNGYLIIVSENIEYIEAIKERFTNIHFIVIDNVQKTLNTLGKFGISNFKGKKFAITGSVGKTTSTYLLNNILKNFYQNICTDKYNSQYYLRRLCFQLYDKNEDIFLAELSSDSLGSIDNFGDIIKPDYSIITAIGNAHIEDFKSFSNIIKEKTSLINHTQNKTFIPIEYEEIIKNEINVINNENKIIYVKNDFIINDEKKEITFNINGNKMVICNPSLKGNYNYSNMNLVLHTIYESYPELFNNSINKNKIINTIENLNPFPGRGNIITVDKDDLQLKIICEYHNANSLSFLKTVENIKEPTVILMGYMYSLGSESHERHEELFTLMENNANVLNVVLCDKKIYELGFILNKYKKLLPAYEDVLFDIITKRPHIKNIFIKGSRSSVLENFVKKILDFCE